MDGFVGKGESKFDSRYSASFSKKPDGGTKRNKEKAVEWIPQKEIDDHEFRNADIMDFIVSNIHDKYLYLVSKKESTKEMWEAIEKTFAKDACENAATIRCKLFNLKFNRDKPISKYIKEFTKKMGSLHNFRDRLKREDSMLQFLTLLPNKYLPLKILIYD